MLIAVAKMAVVTLQSIVTLMAFGCILVNDGRPLTTKGVITEKIIRNMEPTKRLRRVIRQRFLGLILRLFIQTFWFIEVLESAGTC